jgi:chitinase
LFPTPYGPYSVDTAVKTYTGKGVPSNKIFIGIPLYARGFSGTTGLGASSSGASPDYSFQAGIPPYFDILPIAPAVEQWDDNAKAGYSYNQNNQVLDTYDVPQAVLAKCNYVKQNNLGGVIIWESTALCGGVNDRFWRCSLWVFEIFASNLP